MRLGFVFPLISFFPVVRHLAGAEIDSKSAACFEKSQSCSAAQRLPGSEGGETLVKSPQGRHQPRISGTDGSNGPVIARIRRVGEELRREVTGTESKK